MKFDQQEEFEAEFRRRFGVEIFEPGGIRIYKLNVKFTECLRFVMNWIRDIAEVTREGPTVHEVKREIRREKVIIHQLQPQGGIALPMAFRKDSFVECLKGLQLYAIEHEDAATAREIGRILHINGYLQKKTLPDTDTDV